MLPTDRTCTLINGSLRKNPLKLASVLSSHVDIDKRKFVEGILAQNLLDRYLEKTVG